MVLLVENNSGVLARVSSLFMQRGFNIDSLTVSSTENPKISRITVMTTGDQKNFSQIMKQTKKLVETKMIFAVEPSFSLIQELLLVKVSTDGADIEALKADGPVWIECVIDREEKVLPMIPSGGTVNDTISK